MVTLANTLFNSAPTDKLADVDVYKTVDNSLRNALTSKVSVFENSLMDIFNATKAAVFNISNNGSANPRDLDDVRDRIANALASSRVAISNLSGAVVGDIFQQLTGRVAGTNAPTAMNPLADSAIINIGNDSFVTNGVNASTLNAVISMIGDVVVDTDIGGYDAGAKSAVFSGILTEVSTWGIPELVTSLLTGQDKSVVDAAVTVQGPKILASGDVDVLEAYLEAGFGSPLTSLTPNPAGVVLNNYKLKPDVPVDEYPVKANQLFDVLTALQPDWLYTQYAGTETTNYSVLQTANADAENMLNYRSETYLQVQTAKLYPEQDVVKLANSYWPSACLYSRALR